MASFCFCISILSKFVMKATTKKFHEYTLRDIVKISKKLEESDWTKVVKHNLRTAHFIHRVMS
jgi:hypothetical protein